MKTITKINFLLSCVIFSSIVLGQTPQAFKYQTVVRDAAGEILQNQNVSFRFSIHDVNPAGAIIYSETHSVTTSEFGLVNLNVGSGIPVIGFFSAIDWGTNSKYLETEIDPAGGNSYTSMGTSQLLSVPYALYSDNTANNDDADADPDNELQSLSIVGNNLSISDGNTVILPGSGISNRISDNDGDTWIDAERNSDNDSIIFYTSGMERMVISHNGYIEVNGQMIATGFSGDGSGLTGIPGDDLGDHLATQDLDMNGNSITNLDDPQSDSDAANKGYVDAHPGDNLGNHVAAQNIVLGNNWISNDGDIEGISVTPDGYVGINTISDQRLTVAGNIRSSDQVMAGYGTTVSASYRFGAGFENSGLSSPFANSVSVITDGAARMTINSSGNIGIGTTNPANTLHVQGSFRLANGTQANGRILTTDANGTASWTEPSSMIQNEWHTTGNSGTVSGTHFIGTTDAKDLDFRTNNILRARISQKGQIEVFNTGQSVFIGEGSGISDDLSDNRNTFIGHQSGHSNTSGSDNTAIGNGTLYYNTTGSGNTANGVNALGSNTNGYGNTASGKNTLNQNTTGYFNTATGVSALHNNTTGFSNTAVGGTTLVNNTTGFENTAIGVNALNANTIGNNNTADGAHTLRSNTTGTNNTANGMQALYSNTKGNYNTANGTSALFANTTGSRNIAIGTLALQNQSYNNGGETWNSDNVAIGYEALYSNEPSNALNGIFNTALGNYALRSNTTGANNTANGVQALYSNTTGYYNTANGVKALFSNTTGDFNTANGVGALYFNTTGYDNTAIGYTALTYNTTGYGNTAYGTNALFFNATGNNNTALGRSAGFAVSEVDFNQCTFVGASSFPTVNRTNVTMLGYGISNAQCTGDNQVLLGNTAITQIRAQVNSITAYSDARFKNTVKDDVVGLDFIMKLKAVSYYETPEILHQIWGTPDSLTSKIDHSQIKNTRFVGFLAQDVEKAMNESGYAHFPGIDIPKNSNEVYSLRYGDFTMPLVKAVQELADQNQKLLEQNELQAKDIEYLKTELNKLKNNK